jgi:hypothetical protein
VADDAGGSSAVADATGAGVVVAGCPATDR